MGFDLRPYQQRQHDKALATWGFRPWWDGESDTFRSLILKQPTAGGKTITASKIIETLVGLGVRCLFTADTNELVQQPLEKLHRSTGIIAALEKAEHRASLHSMVVVASVQSMSQPTRLQRFPVDHFGAIFADEAHEGPDRSAVVNERFPNAKICGLTATPFRISLADLSKWYETVADELDIDELIEGGYIPPVRNLTEPLDIDLSALKMSTTKEGRDVNAEDSDRRIIPWFEAIVKKVMERAPNAISVAFHGLTSTSRTFVEVCKASGLEARHIDGTSDDRAQILEWFTNATGPRLLSNAQLLRKGWDCDVADTLIPLRITKSIALVRQQAGRVLRPLTGILDGLETAEERRAAIAASSKPFARIFDFLGLCEEMGLAGPASILGGSPEECAAMAKKLKRNPDADLSDIRRKVREEMEEKLRKKLEAEAMLRDRDHASINLVDVRQLALDLHDIELESYQAVMPWESHPASSSQCDKLRKLGIRSDGVTKGLAAAVITKIVERQPKGLAPVEAFPALRAKGIEHPETLSLDNAIRVLGTDFPMTLGNTHRGKPLRCVPMSFWNWLGRPDSFGALNMCKLRHPAVYRYYRHVIKGEPKEQEQPMLL